MNVKSDIEEYSKEEDKLALLWLLEHYHSQSEWRVMASCSIKRTGSLSYQIARIWKPTETGQILFRHRNEYPLSREERSIK